MAYKSIITPSKVNLVVKPDVYIPLLQPDIVKSHIRRANAERIVHVDMFIDTVFNEVFPLGLNPDAILGMSHLETGIWTSAPWMEKLNPGGMGGDTPERQVWFRDGQQAARAMATHLMVYAKGHDNNFKDWIGLDPIYVSPYMAGFAKSARTLAALGEGKWAAAIGYKDLVAKRIAEMRDSWQWDPNFTGNRPPYAY